jgi:hypothetical protein
MKTIIFHCPACNQKIEAPPRLAGQPMQCPTCNQGFVAPKKRHLYTLVMLLLINVIAIGAVVFFANSKTLPIHESPKRDSKIEGLFGLKLDEPLPQDCVILSSNIVRGVLKLEIIPPKTNATFESYSVSLDKQLNVIEIMGSHIVDQGDDDYVTKSYQTISALSDTLTSTLGSAPSRNNENHDFNYYWEDGDREVGLWLHNYWNLILDCSDKKAQDELYNIWEKQQHDSVDTSGIGAGK